MRVIVTRPQRDAESWVRDLRAAGYDALALPLIDIAPAADMQPLQAAWRGLCAYAGVMFVSGHAVDGFFAARPADAPAFGAPTRAWATGPGTRAALLRAGVADAHVDAPEQGQFDSEALWGVMQARVRAGSRVLIVRGADSRVITQAQGLGRDWFAQQVQAAGGSVDFVVAYQRRAPQWDAEQTLRAHAAATDGSVWLFSSSEALANLRAMEQRQDWSQARAIATHPRIAQAAHQTGFGTVIESRPALADIRASLESLR